MLEMQFYLLDVHCLNTKQKAPIPPLVGMKVMKSGAGTGVTGSVVVAVNIGMDTYIDNDAAVPPSIPALPYVFCAHGDSGSVAWLGTPPDPRDATVNPLDLGKPIEDAIAPVVNLEAPADRPAKKQALLEDYRGRAVMLMRAVGAGPLPGIGVPALPNRWCLGPSMVNVLAVFTRLRTKPVIIADD
jgi:hypothetical protein